MRHQRHFDAGEVVLSETARIRKVVVDLDRTVQILDCDVATEEERARLSDRSDAADPVLARTLATRRDNLKDTIAVLEKRIASLQGGLGRPGRTPRQKSSGDRIPPATFFA